MKQNKIRNADRKTNDVITRWKLLRLKFTNRTVMRLSV